MWRDLSSGELRRRLIQRGVPVPIALDLVRRRDRDDEAAVEIDLLLAR